MIKFCSAVSDLILLVGRTDADSGKSRELGGFLPLIWLDSLIGFAQNWRAYFW